MTLSFFLDLFAIYVLQVGMARQTFCLLHVWFAFVARFTVVKLQYVTPCWVVLQLRSMHGYIDSSSHCLQTYVLAMCMYFSKRLAYMRYVLSGHSTTVIVDMTWLAILVRR